MPGAFADHGPQTIRGSYPQVREQLHALWRRRTDRALSQPPHSHSIVPGGLLVTSYTTRFTPFTSLMMRVATWPMNPISNG